MRVSSMVDIKSLLEYNQTIRNRYWDRLSKLPWKEFVKNREASFNSVRNIFVHTLGAIDYWLDFLEKKNLRWDKKFDEYDTFDSVKLYLEHVEKRMASYLRSLSPEKLRKEYTVTGEDHKTTTVQTEDILIHVFEEEVHHRGELIALLWQMGEDPPEMGWKGL